MRDCQLLRPSIDYVALSPNQYAFCWFIFVGLYFIACIFNASYAKFYWGFDATVLSYTLESYKVGMPRESFRTVAYVHIALAAAHGVCALLMIGGSLQQRSLSFSLWASNSVMRNNQTSSNSRSTSSAEALRRNTVQIYYRLVNRRGLFGVNGRHFHTVLICRELLETALQTAQAVRMSKYLPRALLNRFYVSLLLVNCWSSVVIYSRCFWRGEARRRLATIACDSVLDVMTAMGVPVTIVLSYVSQYDVVLTGFSFEFMEDDEWISRMLNEAQIVLVVSWSDLAMRVVFSLGFIISIMNMSDLLCRTTKNEASASSGPRISTQSVGLDDAQPTSTSPMALKGSSVAPTTTARQVSSNQVRPRQTLLHHIHFLFAAWGVVVLVLHVHAAFRMPLVECNPKVHPMMSAIPSCFAVNFNCHELKISGKRDEVETEWGKFDRSSAVKIRFLHCPTLEIPESFNDFSRLRVVQMYNSTILDWGDSAALTNTRHPELIELSVARVNMTEGILPLGFQSADFPIQLFQISFCETNLKTLPSDLDAKWHPASNLYIENSEFEADPPVLARLQPYYLTLVGNPITQFSPELFEVTYTQNLVLDRTSVSELPRNVPQPIGGPAFISLAQTNISFFWSWVDPLVESMLEILPPIAAGGSSYCSDLEKIMQGEVDSFSVPFEEGHSPILMNASKGNWEILRQAVDCSPISWKTQFPLQLWDETYGLT